MKQDFKFDFMSLALGQAQKAFDSGEVPIGAVMVQNGKVIARAHNTREKSKNPLHHAEIRVIEKAARLKCDWRLNDCSLYVTLEPCPMCLGALFQARVGRLIVGCLDPKRKSGSKSHARGDLYLPSLGNFSKNPDEPFHLVSNNHELEFEWGTCADEASTLLKEFFKTRRRD